MLHEQAIYQHDGEYWQVEKLRLREPQGLRPQGEARLLHRRDDLHDGQRPRGVRNRLPNARAVCAELAYGWGEVSVVEKVVGYKKIKFYTHENAGYGDVRLPEMQMHTTAFWLTARRARARSTSRRRAPRIDGLRGARHRARDGRDARAHVRSARPRDDRRGRASRRDRRGQTVLFFYEHVPGGTGLAERIFALRERARRARAQARHVVPVRGGVPRVRGAGGAHRRAQARRGGAARGANVTPMRRSHHALRSVACNGSSPCPDASTCTDAAPDVAQVLASMNASVPRGGARSGRHAPTSS